jgi:dynactin-5
MMISSFRDDTIITPSTHHITSSGNLISVNARIQGPTAIVLHGRNIVGRDVVLRGDLRGGGQGEEGRALVMGRYCRVGEGSVLRPPGKVSKG